MKKSGLFNFSLLSLLFFASSGPKLSAMEEDEKGNKIPQKQTSKEDTNTPHSFTDSQSDDTEEFTDDREESTIENTSYLGKLPAELIERIFLYTLAPVKNLDEANKSLNVFNNVIYKTCAVNDFINKNYTDPTYLCSRCMNINPFFITRKLKISEELHRKLTKIALEQELKKFNHLYKHSITLDMLWYTVSEEDRTKTESERRADLTKLFLPLIWNLHWEISKKTEEWAKIYTYNYGSDGREIACKSFTILSWIYLGANINEIDNVNGFTILQQAIAQIPKPFAALKFVELFLNLGANPNLKRDGRLSALQWAIERYILYSKKLSQADNIQYIGNLQYMYSDPNDLSILESIIRTLLEFGADPNVTYNDGHTCLYYARINDLPNIGALLKEYGAKLSWRDIFSWKIIKF